MTFKERGWFWFGLGITTGATLVVAGMIVPYLLI